MLCTVVQGLLMNEAVKEYTSASAGHSVLIDALRSCDGASLERGREGAHQRLCWLQIVLIFCTVVTGLLMNEAVKEHTRASAGLKLY
jgi:hypothetical protein